MTDIILDDAQSRQLYDALAEAEEIVCSACCPSQWKCDERPPHSDKCRRIKEARFMLMSEGSWADLRASGGIAESP